MYLCDESESDEEPELPGKRKDIEIDEINVNLSKKSDPTKN